MLHHQLTWKKSSTLMHTSAASRFFILNPAVNRCQRLRDWKAHRGGLRGAPRPSRTWQRSPRTVRGAPPACAPSSLSVYLGCGLRVSGGTTLSVMSFGGPVLGFIDSSDSESRLIFSIFRDLHNYIKLSK